ncbi:hypothetical protein E4U43_002433 [Claviceps pusilla]|uniref:Mitochondrial carrier family protein n=1 Tax=Claviceps pusilla TaxID=123648 RepID=A0A9P7N8C3_9HYPO|nr:hypothetical protein E4U43_002433 [Claviceps pusilla]
MASTTFTSTSHTYDRFPDTDEAIMSARDSMPAVGVGGSGGGGGGGGDDEPIPDITASQKMISAMSGSLFTSLLVTPLDVVRVRLQSQIPPTSAVDFSKLALRTSSLTPAQTAELGVTACCREVFFQGNSAELCIAVPRGAGEGLNTRLNMPATSSSLSSSLSAASDCAVHEVRQKTFNSTLDGLRKIARNEGVTTLWRGLSPTLLMTIPANIIYFTGYDWLRYNAMSPFSRLSGDQAPLVAGSSARTLAATAVGPIELFRTRMQAASGASTTNHLTETLRGVREMVAAHGYVSLWRGLTLTLWRDVPFSGLYWWGYETIRAGLTDAREERRGRSLSQSQSQNRSHSRSRRDDGLERARRRSQSRENHMDTFVDSFTAGALSGALASMVTMPFDVGKTRTQVYRDAPASASAAVKRLHPLPEETSMVRLLWHIFQTEGVAGLWKGWIPRTLKVAPACAIMISSYEVGKRVFRGVNERSLREDMRSNDG